MKAYLPARCHAASFGKHGLLTFCMYQDGRPHHTLCTCCLFYPNLLVQDWKIITYGINDATNIHCSPLVKDPYPRTMQARSSYHSAGGVVSCRIRYKTECNYDTQVCDSITHWFSLSTGKQMPAAYQIFLYVIHNNNFTKTIRLWNRPAKVTMQKKLWCLAFQAQIFWYTQTNLSGVKHSRLTVLCVGVRAVVGRDLGFWPRLAPGVTDWKQTLFDGYTVYQYYSSVAQALLKIVDHNASK